MYDLKKNIILNYDLDVFLDFFDILNLKYKETSINKFDMDLIKTLKDKLYNDSYLFFEYIYNHAYYISFDDIFYKFSNQYLNLNKMNGYLNEVDYKKLRNILENKDISFTESNILTLKNKLINKKFDLILLSNISDYIHNLYNENELLNYSYLIDNLMDNLNDNGIIQVGYIYSNKHEEISLFSDDLKRHEVFTTDKFNTIFVQAYEDNTKKDKVITYKKNKK